MSAGVVAVSEPSREDARSVDVVAVRTTLFESARRWSVIATSESRSIDRLWIGFECGACGESFGRVFACPEQPAAPLYRGADEVEGAVDALLAGRCPLIDPPTWRAAAECPCDGPRHLVAARAAALFHPMVGSGAGLVVARIGGGSEWYRLAEGSGAFGAVDPASLRGAFGRPLTLFDALVELLPQLPPKPSTIVGTAAEPGVWFFAAEGAAALELGVDAKLEGRPRIVVRLEPALARSALWHPALRELAGVLKERVTVALVVETEALLAQAQVWARARLDGEVHVEPGADLLGSGELRLSAADGSGPAPWVFASESGHWPIDPRAIAVTMARTGQPMGEAVASASTEAARALADRVATLRALVEQVPGGSFDVEGAVAIARASDGRAVRTIQLVELPAGAGELPPEMLAREAAFLFDAAPPWASRARVCPCGAALSVESRLVAWPWADASRRPKVVRTWADEHRGAAEVVALCCDRHVRIPSVAELEALGLSEDRLAARLDADIAETRPRVHATIWRGPEGERAAMVRGPFAASFVLSDARAVALHDALGAPVEGARLTAWALGTDLALLVAEDADDSIVARVLVDLGMSSLEPFWLRRDVDLGVEGVGGFEVVMDRPGLQ